MNKVRSYSSPLRQQQAEETRHRIVEAALDSISEYPESSFSHEEISKAAGIALRTVYRHFPSRTELLDAVWQESDRRLGLIEYPDTEEGMLASVTTVFGKMDENESLIVGLLNSDAGREMRRRDNERRRLGVVKALEQATAHLPEAEAKQVIALFQALFGGRTWEMLRNRGHLGRGEPAQAVTWAMRTLLDALYREQKRLGRAERRATTPVRSGRNGTSKRVNLTRS